MSDNKRIAKNTMFLYIRMIFIMGVTLFTSRVVLDKLGAEDYGIYGVVGGVVGMLSFLNGTLSTGTSRFLTYNLGTGNLSQLKVTFNTTFYTHLILAVIVALVMETGGMWFLYNKLIIPEERLFAAECVFHVSIVTAIINITQVPYTSLIIANENMKVYAYVGIFEACAKLLVVYLLILSDWDRLIYYAILLGVVQIIVAYSYRYYCVKNYNESRLHLQFDKQTCRSLLTFSGWSLIANVSEMLGHQGLVVLINIFFAPVVVAAQTIATQITTAIMQFVNNFRTAINPQIIKLYASGNQDESRRLTLNSSIYVFDLLLLLGLPVIVIMKPLMGLWLVEVPDYAVIFAQYTIIKSILANWSVAFYVPMMASGELKWNSVASVFVTFLGFAILYMLLYNGMDVMWVQWVSIIQACLYSFFVKPYILCWKIGYSWVEILACFGLAVKIVIFPIFVSWVAMTYLLDNGFVNICLSMIFPAVAVLISAFVFMDVDSKEKIFSVIRQKIS